jgi:hypothetical protein
MSAFGTCSCCSLNDTTMLQHGTQSPDVAPSALIYAPSTIAACHLPADLATTRSHGPHFQGRMHCNVSILSC